MISDSERIPSRILSVAAGCVLLCLAALLTLSLLIQMLGYSSTVGVLTKSGWYLHAVYGYASFFVPAFLLFASILLLVPVWNRYYAAVLSGGPVTFFTLVFGEKLAAYFSSSSSSSGIAAAAAGGIWLSALMLIALEYIGLFYLADWLASRTGGQRSGSSKQRPIAAVHRDRSKNEQKNAFQEAEPPLDVMFREDSTDALIEDLPILDEDQLTDLVEADELTEVLPDWENSPFDLEAVTAPETAALVAEVADASEIEYMPASSDADRDEEPEELGELDDLDNLEYSADRDLLPARSVPDELDDLDPALVDIEEDDFFTDIDMSLETDIDGNPVPEQDIPVPELDIPVLSATPLPQAAPVSSRKRGPYSVPYDILTTYPDGEYWVVDDATRRAAAALKETLNEFRIQADVTGIRKGPVITMFEILPAPGVKLSKIVGLQDNIALRLAASSVRIVAPIPGKHAVGIEVPNQKRSIVSFRELIEGENPSYKKMEIPVVLGKDIAGEAQLLDLTATPHLLIAGSTGSGKSVCVNSIILSILYKRSPAEVRLILIDPKIVELKLYNDIPHLLAPVITEPKKAYQSLQYCLCEMERRYALLDGMGVRDIRSYNRRIKERNIATEKLPYLVVIIDEFADLMATTGKELESTVARLAAMSRAVGIHLVLATQRPSIDVITGLIKANIPTRIAFMVASKMDSRIIIDQVGAEKLLGRGDMLYASATDPFPVRIQGAYVSEEEVERVVEHVKTLGEPEYIDDEIFFEDDDDAVLEPGLFSDGDDPLYDKALEIVLLAGKASASYIQRRLKIGYNRAARLVEDMEARGIVGPANGSKPRDVLQHPH